MDGLDHLFDVFCYFYEILIEDALTLLLTLEGIELRERVILVVGFLSLYLVHVEIGLGEKLGGF